MLLQDCMDANWIFQFEIDCEFCSKLNSYLGEFLVMYAIIIASIMFIIKSQVLFVSQNKILLDLPINRRRVQGLINMLSRKDPILSKSQKYIF